MYFKDRLKYYLPNHLAATFLQAILVYSGFPGHFV